MSRFTPRPISRRPDPVQPVAVDNRPAPPNPPNGEHHAIRLMGLAVVQFPHLSPLGTYKAMIQGSRKPVDAIPLQPGDNGRALPSASELQEFAAAQADHVAVVEYRPHTKYWDADNNEERQAPLLLLRDSLAPYQFDLANKEQTKSFIDTTISVAKHLATIQKPREALVAEGFALRNGKVVYVPGVPHKAAWPEAVRNYVPAEEKIPPQLTEEFYCDNVRRVLFKMVHGQPYAATLKPADATLRKLWKRIEQTKTLLEVKQLAEQVLLQSPPPVRDLLVPRKPVNLLKWIVAAVMIAALAAAGWTWGGMLLSLVAAVQNTPPDPHATGTDPGKGNDPGKGSDPGKGNDPAVMPNPAAPIGQGSPDNQPGNDSAKNKERPQKIFAEQAVAFWKKPISEIKEWVPIEASGKGTSGTGASDVLNLRPKDIKDIWVPNDEEKESLKKALEKIVHPASVEVGTDGIWRIRNSHIHMSEILTELFKQKNLVVEKKDATSIDLGRPMVVFGAVMPGIPSDQLLGTGIEVAYTIIPKKGNYPAVPWTKLEGFERGASGAQGSLGKVDLTAFEQKQFLPVVTNREYDVHFNRANGGTDIIQGVVLASQEQSVIEKSVKELFERAGMQVPSLQEFIDVKTGQDNRKGYSTNVLKVVSHLRRHFHPVGADAEETARLAQERMEKQDKANPAYRFIQK